MRTNLDTKHLMATAQVQLPFLSNRWFNSVIHWLINLVRLGNEQIIAEAEGPGSE